VSQGIPDAPISPLLGMPGVAGEAAAEIGAWQPPEKFQPVHVAMPTDGEARRRISMYQTEVMMPQQ